MRVLLCVVLRWRRDGEAVEMVGATLRAARAAAAHGAARASGAARGARAAYRAPLHAPNAHAAARLVPCPNLIIISHSHTPLYNLILIHAIDYFTFN